MFPGTGRWVQVAAIGAFSLAVGCSGGSFSLSLHDDRPVRRVYIDPGPVHVCSHDCHHHYWDGGRLIVLAGHRHGPGCGHHFDGGHWIRLSARGGRVHVDASPVHICSHDCHHHYWDGGRLVVLTGHRHGPGCGHVFKSNRWSLISKSPAARHRKAPVVRTRKAPVVRTRKAPIVQTRKAPVVRTRKAPVVRTRKAPVERTRKATASPQRKGSAGHAQKTPKRVKKAKHVHGPGCGHVRVNGKWVKRR